MEPISIAFQSNNQYFSYSSTGHRSTRAGNDQAAYLVAYMEEHSFMARCQVTKLGAAGVDKWRRLCDTLAEDLNGLGPAQKSTEGWMQVIKLSVY